MPNLVNVSNAFQVRSLDTRLDCSIFDKYQRDRIITGAYTCEHFRLDGSTIVEKLSLPTATKIGIAIATVLGTILFAIVVFLFIRIRRRKASSKEEPAGVDRKPEKDGIEVENKKPQELEIESSELPTGLEAQELAAQHGVVEAGGGEQFELPADEVAHEVNDAGSNEDRSASRELRRKPVGSSD